MTLALVLWVVGMGVVWAVVAGGTRKQPEGMSSRLPITLRDAAWAQSRRVR